MIEEDHSDTYRSFGLVEFYAANAPARVRGFAAGQVYMGNLIRFSFFEL